MMIRNIECDTTPIVIHNNGPYRRPFFYRLRSRILSRHRKIRTHDLDLTIFTWNNKPRKGCFERSLVAPGLDYFVTGKKIVEWRNIFKVALNHEFLKRVETTYVRAADSSDILLLDDSTASNYRDDWQAYISLVVRGQHGPPLISNLHAYLMARRERDESKPACK